jgi:photosystem II stability/assembly factor-like uncharacterized protein
MAFGLYKKQAAVLVVAFILVGSVFVLLNKKGQNPIDRIAKMNAPSDYIFWQRSYPDAEFDIKAYEDALKEERQRTEGLSARSRTGINTPWNLEGPFNIGGRINTIAVHPQIRNIILVGNAAGGIFKTTNGGADWYPVFDGHLHLSISHIVFDPVNPSVLYAGTGDKNIGGYFFIGDGVYKSTDGGETWFNIGLSEERIISKILINPNNTNIIYAAAMGLPSQRNNNRGLYKSIDGGGTWSQVLFLSTDAGIIDMVMDPLNPDIIYAAGWNRIRSNQESIVAGPEGKIFKTTDGGNTWVALSNGLPSGSVSRIGLTMSSKSPNTLFAAYVDATTLNLLNIYKSTNGGANWQPIPLNNLDPSALGGFGWYFGEIRVSPFNDNELFLLGVDLHKTSSGGSNWEMAGPPWWQYEVHADKHDLVYLDSLTILLSTDGGIYKSINGGVSFTRIDNLPNTQFYRVGINPHQPLTYYGGAQDQGTMSGNAITGNNWERIFGGDGFQPLFDPGNANLFYVETQNGGLYYTENGGGFFNSLTTGIDNSDRRSWDMPFNMGKTNSKTLYTGTYRMYRMEEAPYGVWEPISEDLTKGVIFGGRFHVISAIDDSPLNPNLLYAATSDGYAWVSTDGGATSWSNISSGLPDRYVTSIKASPNTANNVYVAHSGYRANSYIPHIHKSTNRGQTWTDISGNLPQLAINDIEVLPGHNDSVIFVASDGGVYVTFNGGQFWERLGQGMPVVPVFDIAFNKQSKKLIAGTFARSLMTFPMDSILNVKDASVRALDIAKPQVFPSLAASSVTVRVPDFEAFMQIRLINSSGMEVLAAEKLKSNETVLDVRGLKPGMYFIVIEGSRKAVLKFIKT